MSYLRNAYSWIFIYAPDISKELLRSFILFCLFRFIGVLWPSTFSCMTPATFRSCSLNINEFTFSPCVGCVSHDILPKCHVEYNLCKCITSMKRIRGISSNVFNFYVGFMLHFPLHFLSSSIRLQIGLSVTISITLWYF